MAARKILVVTGGLLTLAVFAVWWFSTGTRVHAGQASPAGVVRVTMPGYLFIFTGADTTDIYFTKATAVADTLHVEQRRLPMEWRDVP